VTHLYDILAPALGIANAAALLVLFYLLVNGHARQYWTLLFYVGWELLATAALTIADLYLNGTTQSHSVSTNLYAWMYWSNDVTVDLFRFTLAAVLIYKTLESPQPWLKRVLLGVGVAIVVISALFWRDRDAQHPFAWLNSISQLINFGAAILNVVLWTAILQSKKRDTRIMAVSIGLGILVAGTAFSYGLRHFNKEGQFTAVVNLFLNLTQLLAWLIWCRAFWPDQRPKAPSVS